MVVRRFKTPSSPPLEAAGWWECTDCRLRFVPVLNHGDHVLGYAPPSKDPEK